MDLCLLFFLVGAMLSSHPVHGSYRGLVDSDSVTATDSPVVFSLTANTVGGGLKTGEIEDLFHEGDLDGSGELDYEEFLKLFTNYGSPIPSAFPSTAPSLNPALSMLPTKFPSVRPSTSLYPTAKPSPETRIAPSVKTDSPTESPRIKPTAPASHEPSQAPSAAPTNFVKVTKRPTAAPSDLSSEPTATESFSLSGLVHPSNGPTQAPSGTPTKLVKPTRRPSVPPSERPTIFTSDPTITNSASPTNRPSESPSKSSIPPTGSPSTSMYPSETPFMNPSTSIHRSTGPSVYPTITPSTSMYPSAMPSGSPSESVTPSFKLSENPSSGRRELVANTTITLRDVPGMMDDDAIVMFEEIGLLLLVERFPRMESFDIDFLFVQVEGQVLRGEGDGREPVGDLTVYLRIAATIMPGKPSGFDFQGSMVSFFEAHEDLLASRIENNGIVFQPSPIQGDGAAENATEAEGEESFSEFFSTSVIAGISVTMVSVLVVGAFIISRPMWRRSKGYSMESPGRLGAAPSYDSEDHLDPQSIFMSFSQESKQGAANSYYTTSTSGSHLAGLDIDNCLSSSSIGSRGTFSKEKTSHRHVGPMGSGLSTEEYEDIRNRSNNILDDLDSQLSDFSGVKDSVEVKWDGRSRHPSMPSIEENSSSESLARQRKRKLERKLQESKGKLGSHIMETLSENEQVNVQPRSGLSMKDFILPTCSLGGEVLNTGSYTAQFNSILSPEDKASSPGLPILDKKKMTPSELFDLGEHIPVEMTHYHSEKKVYGRISDVSGTIVEADVDINSRRTDTTTVKINQEAAEDPDHPFLEEDENKVKSSGWFRRGQTTEKQPESNFTKTRNLSLFGRKKNIPWEDNVDFSQISPNKRYRRGERGQLVPRRFAHGDSDDEESQIASQDCYMDDPSLILLPAVSSSESGHNSKSSSQKSRPPKLDLNVLDECDYSDPEDRAETPEFNRPNGTPEALPMTYGRGLLYGQDPDGFALTNANKRLPEHLDPPTASEHRRTVAAKKQEKKSALRKKDSPRRLSKEDRVSFSKRTMEFSNDAFMLGHVESNNSGNMI